MNSEIPYRARAISSLSLIAGFGAVAVATFGLAQDELEGVYDLDAVVVSANRLEMPIQQVGSSVEILEGYDLVKGQETFLLDNLRLIPGLYLRNNGGPGAAAGITVRGMTSYAPKVLLNGIEVSNPSNGTMLNFGSLMTGNVARVEVLKGAQSSLYGADALSGVISIDTLNPEQAPGGRLNVAYGSYDTLQVAIGHSGSQGDLSWAVDFSRQESEGHSYKDPELGPEWEDDDSYETTNLSAKLQYALNDDSKVYFSTYYIDASSEFDPSEPNAWSAPFADSWSNNESLALKLGSEFQLADNWTSSASFAYTTVDYLSHTESDYFSEGDRYKLDWINQVDVSEGWRFVAGVEYEEEDNRSDVGDRDDTSIFMENVLSVTEDLDVTVGARFDDNSAYGNETTYRTTFSYRIDEADTRVHGSWGTSFQAPSFYQLFNGFYGNPDLLPESGKSVELGVEKLLFSNRLMLSVTLFKNDIDDKIVWSGVYENLDTFESEGIETAIRYQANEVLSFSLAHTYSDAEEGEGVEALRAPKNVLSFGTYWTGLDGNLVLGFNGIAVSSQISQSGDRFSESRQDGYDVFNLSGDYRLDENMSLWARVGNLFDEDYEEIGGYETAGINLTVGMRTKF